MLYQLINNAGYFYEPEETLDNINFDEQLKQFNICAVGPLRVSAAFLRADLLQKGSKIIMITSQGGSVSWRFTQNPEGHDYGHHVRNGLCIHSFASDCGDYLLYSRSRVLFITNSLSR